MMFTSSFVKIYRLFRKLLMWTCVRRLHLMGSVLIRPIKCRNIFKTVLNIACVFSILHIHIVEQTGWSVKASNLYLRGTRYES